MQLDIENTLVLLDIESEMDEIEHQIDFGAGPCEHCFEVLIGGLNDIDHQCD